MPKVLIVEDELPLQLALQKKMEKLGLEVLTARSAKEAWEHLDAHVDIDALWLDHYLLGDESGLDIAVKVKEDETRKNMPIFVVSNTATDEKVKSYLKLGVDKYYTKAHTNIDEIVNELKDIVS